MSEEYGPDFISVTDEEGNEFELEHLGTLENNGCIYMAFVPADMDEDDEDFGDDEEFENPVDIMFRELQEKNPNHFAVRQYAKYRLAAGKTAKSILVSCGARLAVFDIAELRDVMAYDELELDKLGDRKTALFLIMSDTDATLISLSAWFTRSCSTYFAKKQMMSMAEGFRCM